MRASLFIASLLLSPVALAGNSSSDDGLAWQDPEEDLFFDNDLDRDRKSAKDEEYSDGGFDFEEPEEEFDLLEDGIGEEDAVEDFESFDAFGDPEEDFDMLGEDPAPRRKPAAAAPAGPGPITLDVAGKDPLADNYPLSVVAVDRDAVVVELPVLVARSRVGHEEDFTLTARVMVGDEVVNQVSQLVSKASLAEFGPSFSWFKMLAPVVEKRGEVTVTVLKGEEELYSRSVPYSL